MICPNLNDPAVKEEFDRLAAAIGEDAAYNKWYYYDGNVPESEYGVSQEYIPSFKPIEAEGLKPTLENYLTSLNVDVNYNDFINYKGLKIRSATDLLYKSTYINNNFIEEGLLKETAYIAYSFLGKKSKIKTDLIYSVDQIDNYKELYEKYKTKSQNLSDYKIKELIIVDLIADSIYNNYNTPKDSYINRQQEFWSIKGNSEFEKKLKYALLKIKQFILNLININNKLTSEELELLIDDIAHDVLVNNLKKFNKDLKADQQLTNYTDSIKKDPFAEEIVNNFQNLGIILTGSLSLRQQGTLYRTEDENLHDLDFTVPYNLFKEDLEKLREEKNNSISEVKKQFLSNNPQRKELIQSIITNYSTNLKSILYKTDFYKQIKELYPSLKEIRSFAGSTDESFVWTGIIDDKYLIDLFLTPNDKLGVINKKGFQNWESIFKAKLQMGRQKDLVDFANYKPFNITLENQLDTKGFRHFNFEDGIQENTEEDEEEFIPSFKPKPSNTLSLLKQEEFKNSLVVGEKAQPFLYWSETTSKQVAEKGVIVDRILNDRFEGRYVDTDEERTFKFGNVIDESLEREMTRNQQKFYKSTLVLGETIDIETQQETYTGEIIDIGEDEVQIQDANGGIIAIPYNIIFKPNAQMKLAKLVQKLKQTFSTQLAIYRRSAKSPEQQKRIESYETILKTLENYNQIEDFTVFLQEANNALFRAKAILDRVVSPNNTEGNEKKLYVISYVKDLLNSFKNIKDLSTIIEDFEGSDILKGYMEDFNNRLSTAEAAFKNVAIPQLANLLWDYYDPRLNDKMIEVGLDPYTKERLMDELSDPSRDIDFFNQVFVAPSNVNDVIMGLFVKMIKGGKEQARLQDAKFLTNIVPLIEKLKKKYGHEKFKEILKTFYKIVPVTEERDGKEVTIEAREFIKEHDYTEYYQTIKEFKRRINEVEARKAAAESALMVEYTPEMDQERLNADGELYALKRARREFYDEKGRGVSDIKFKSTMDNNFTFDPEVFYDDLKGYYTQVTDPDEIAELNTETSISIQNDATGEIEHYIRNERIKSEPNPEKYVTKEWELLTNDNADQDIKNLLVALIDEYNTANRKLPYTRRIKNNKVPCLKKQDTLNNLKSIWEKIGKAISEGKFFSKAYAKIREEVRAFLETGSPKYRRRMDGKPYREIPIGVTSIMDIEDSSDDIIMSTLMFVREANNFSYMNKFVGSSEVIIDVLTLQDPLDEEQPEGVEVEINRRKEALLSFFKQQIYGEFNTTHGPLSKTIDFLGKATALTTIGLNPKSWLANFFVGNWNNLAEGFGGRFYTVSDIITADKQFMKMLWNEKERKKLMNMISSLDAIQGRFSKTFGTELMSFKEKYANMDTLFIGQDLAEIQIQGSAMLAMLKSQGIAIPEDGIFTEENTPDLQNFKNLLHAVNKRNHGVYNDFDRLHFQTNAVFRLFLQFRKWVVSTFRARYSGAMTGEYRIDIEMGSVEKGWYRLFYEYFRDSFKNGLSLVEAIKDINNPNLTDVQREGIRRTTVDFLAFVIGSILIFAMTWGDEGDDEEDFVGEYFIIYYLMRLVSEIGVYLPFLGFSDKLRMVANPFGASSTIKDIIGLFGTVMDFEVDKDGNVSIFKEYQRDTGRYEKGDLKVWGKLSKLNTASNFLEITDPKQLIENFEAASRM
jgi:hypothetical protein